MKQKAHQRNRIYGLNPVAILTTQQHVYESVKMGFSILLPVNLLF